MPTLQDNEILKQSLQQGVADLNAQFDEQKQSVERFLGRNSIDIFVGLNLCLNPCLSHFPTRRLPKRVLIPCLNLRLNSSLRFQMSIELRP